jgi:2,4-dienoyl-CoA reductase-like NADH-dependent reductase (Old Yellow Enzyme family)
MKGTANPPSVSASATPFNHPRTGKPLKTDTYKGKEDNAVPRELRVDEMPRLCADYAHAAKNALAAGFDGVEVNFNL